MALIKIKEKEEAKEYPYLGKINRKIVLFLKPNCGIHLQDSYKLSEDIASIRHGTYETNWDESCFKKFTGTVIVQNSYIHISMTQIKDGSVNSPPTADKLKIAPVSRKTKSFQEELTILINTYSQENKSHTPDFILAQYIQDSLDAFNKSVEKREKWYGRKITQEAEIIER